jgi:hypothetical protein
MLMLVLFFGSMGRVCDVIYVYLVDNWYILFIWYDGHSVLWPAFSMTYVLYTYICVICGVACILFCRDKSEMTWNSEEKWWHACRKYWWWLYIQCLFCCLYSPILVRLHCVLLSFSDVRDCLAYVSGHSHFLETCYSHKSDSWLMLWSLCMRNGHVYLKPH